MRKCASPTTDSFNSRFSSILGDDSQKKRHEAVQSFQNEPDVEIAVCSLKAAAEGLTLTAAAHVAFAELGWTPKDLAQASDRVHRIGQDRPVTVWTLIASDTIDLDMEELLEQKLHVVSTVVDGKRQRNLLGRSVQHDLLDRLKERACNRN